MRCPETLDTVLQADGHGHPGGSWRVMGSAGTWCARSCRRARCLCRNKPQDRYQCYLAIISGPHVVLIIAYLSARELPERRPGPGDGCSLHELTFSSSASARQMNRGAGEPALSMDGEEELKVGRETLLFPGSKQ